MSVRATAIVEEVLRRGEVSVEALAGRLSVSPATVRRDLAALEKQGLLRRTHGGVTAVSPVAYEASATTRPSRSRRAGTRTRSAGSASPRPSW